MAKLTLADLTSLANETAAISTINANNALIEAIVELLVSRDGTAPNTMTSALDMNSKRILNLLDATAAQEPVTKSQLDTASSLTNSDASITNYTATGTGAVERTVKSRLDERRTIQDFGATGNGAADDTTKVQAAVDSLTAGDTLYVSDFIYGVSDPITVTTDGITIEGFGSFKAIGTWTSQQTVFDIQADNVTLKYFTVDQNNAISAGRSITVTNSTNTVIEGVRSVNVQQAFIRIGDAAVNTYVRYTNHKSKGYGILVDDPLGSTGLYTNTNMLDLNNGDGDGIEINAPTNGFSGYILSHDIIKNATGNATNQGLGIGLAGASNGQIIAPEIFNCTNDGIHVEAGSNNVLILGGSVRSVCTLATNASGGIAISGSADVTFIGTTIDDVQKKHGAVMVFLNSVSCTRCKFIGLQIDGAFQSGISLDGTTDCYVSDFLVRNANTENSTHFGVRIIKNTTQVNAGLTVTDGKVIDGTNPVTRAIDIGGTAMSSGRISNNDTSGCATPRIQDNGSNTFNRNHNVKSDTDKLVSTVTLTAGTSTVVSNDNCDILEETITLKPLDSAGAALTGVFVSASTIGSFTITHSTAAGTEVFGYEINT